MFKDLFGPKTGKSSNYLKIPAILSKWIVQIYTKPKKRRFP